MLEIRQLINNPASSNCYVIYDKKKGCDCLIVDPGSEDSSSLFELLKTESLNPEYIILSHEHFDHCWGVNDIRNHFPSVKLICSSICSFAIQDKKKNHSVFYQQPGFEVASADIILEDISWQFDWNDYKLSFFSVQGHTASGVVFVINRNLFTGDELIKDIKTVTKLKSGSKEKLHDSILFFESLKGSGFSVYPGHGEMFELDDYDLNRAIGLLKQG